MLFDRTLGITHVHRGAVTIASSICRRGSAFHTCAVNTAKQLGKVVISLEQHNNEYQGVSVRLLLLTACILLHCVGNLWNLKIRHEGDLVKVERLTSHLYCVVVAKTEPQVANLDKYYYVDLYGNLDGPMGGSCTDEEPLCSMRGSQPLLALHVLIGWRHRRCC